MHGAGRVKIAGMDVRFNLPLYVLLDFERAVLPGLRHKGRNLMCVFTDLENGRLFCKRLGGNYRFQVLDDTDKALLFVNSASPIPEPSTFDVAIDPIDLDVEFHKMTRDHFMKALHDSRSD